MIARSSPPAALAAAAVASLLLSASPCCSFVSPVASRGVSARWASPSPSSSAAAAAASSSAVTDDPLGLTPELRRMTDAFASIPDEKNRYKQLMYMANQLRPIPDEAKVPENKVPGCLSTVHVVATKTYSEDRGCDVVEFGGDSDGILTKGLVALLIRGLNGATADEVRAVDPEFIHEAKISQSLTPGRNNGFLNMLAVMKKKADEAVGGGGAVAEAAAAAEAEDEAAAEEAEEEEAEGAAVVTTFDQIEGKPMYNEIMSKLIMVLKPTSITLTDNSDQHAGHAGSKGWEESGESHFALEIVAEAFDGVPLVKRHQLVYLLLGETMQKIHALQISAKSPEEVSS